MRCAMSSVVGSSIVLIDLREEEGGCQLIKFSSARRILFWVGGYLYQEAGDAETPHRFRLGLYNYIAPGQIWLNILRGCH